ncbi:MAG: S8 family peptidase [Candidatus Methylomirabilales bacterium]
MRWIPKILGAALLVAVWGVPAAAVVAPEYAAGLDATIENSVGDAVPKASFDLVWPIDTDTAGETKQRWEDDADAGLTFASSRIRYQLTDRWSFNIGFRYDLQEGEDKGKPGLAGDSDWEIGASYKLGEWLPRDTAQGLVDQGLVTAFPGKEEKEIGLGLSPAARRDIEDFVEDLEFTTSLMGGGTWLDGGLRISGLEEGWSTGQDGSTSITGITGGRLSGTTTFGGFSWKSDYPIIEGRNDLMLPLWDFDRFVLWGPCIKGPGSVEDDEWWEGYHFTFKFFPKIGFSVQNYAYGVDPRLAGLTSCADVTVEEDPVFGAALTPNDPHFAATGSWGQAYADQWALQRIGFKALEDQTSAWHLTTGTERPVVVAVIDTGIDLTHPDLHINNIWFNEKEVPGNGRDDDENGYIDDLIGWNFVHNTNNPFDLVGHGTHVAGLIVARWNNGRGIAGINRGARIMVLKALNEVGKGWGSDIARAIVYAVDNGAQIINLSAEHEGHTQFLEKAFAYAQKQGVLVVVAGGNKGLDTKGVEPANQPGTLVVAATLPDDKRAGFSNWGQEVDVAAPGMDVLSLRARRTDLIRKTADDPSTVEPGRAVVGRDRWYYRAGGTSFSAPLVSGLASLIWAKNPQLTHVQVARMIRQSARDIEVPGWDQFTGYGLLDARAALAADPAFFIEARIAGVQVARRGKKVFLQVNGTINADRLKKAWIEIGKGEKPSEWKKVSQDVTQPVQDGALDAIPASHFKGAKQWTIRLMVEHENGKKREAWFSLKLG